MSDLNKNVIKNIFKYLAIKSHYLFRQSEKLKTLMISKHDWKYYENNYEITPFKTIEYKIIKNNNFDYGNDSKYKHIEYILFYVGYKIMKDMKNIKIKDDHLEVHMLLNTSKQDLDMNHIFFDVISFDITSSSLFNDFYVFSNKEVNKFLKIINRDIPKETKTSLSYKLIESEYFENPNYLYHTQFILSQGLKGQLRFYN